MRIICIALISIQIYIGIGNIFDGCFDEEYEVAIAVLDDGRFFTLSTRESNEISVSPGFLNTYLEKQGYSIDRITILIHSHVFGLARFSLRDESFLKKLKNYGFKGSYMIYHKPTKTYRIHK